MNHLVVKSLLFTLALSYSLSTVGQAIETDFGKNRIQYHDDFQSWSRYETENIITYWYGKAKNVAHTVVQIAELEHDDIQELLEYRMNEKVEIVVYTDITDLKQSNIGNEEIFNNTLGETKTVGRKAFVYFDGNHKNLQRQIRQGIAAVYINSILSGSSLQEVVQNALLLNLPDWFVKGLVSYADQSWSIDMHQKISHLLVNEKNYKFDRFAERYPREAGHSLWHYLEHKYGRTKISQIIYITRIYRSLEGSFPYVLNVPYDQVLDDWANYYRELYAPEREQGVNLPGYPVASTKKKHQKRITHISINPQGNILTYVVNQIGRQDVMMVDLETGESQRLLRNDVKNPFQAQDVNYPLMTWHPSGKSVFILYEKNDVKYLRLQYLFEKDDYEEKDVPENYQRVYSMDYVDDQRLLFSGAYNGVSDLFYYKPKSRSTKRITDDFWDDLEANYIKTQDDEGIIFKSNRLTYELKDEKLDSILPIDAFDIYFLPAGSNECIQLTNSPGVDECQAILYDDNLIYLQELNKTQGRLVKGFLKPSSAHLNSNPLKNIIAHTISNTGVYAYLVEDENYYEVYVDRGPDLDYAFEKPRRINSQSDEADIEVSNEEEETVSDGKLFQSQFADPPGTPRIISNKSFENSDFGDYYENYYTESKTAGGKPIIKYEPYRANAMRTTFRIFDYSSNVDNEPMFGGVETFTPISQTLRSQPTTLHSKVVFKDVFEDYTVTGGFRVPTAFNGSEAYLTFLNARHRWDREYTLYRKVETELVPDAGLFDRFKRHTIIGQGKLIYPFSIYGSLRLTGMLRLDKSFSTLTEFDKLSEPFQFDKRISVRGEYVYDTSYDVLLNIKNGIRAKAYVEVINAFDLDIQNGFNFSPSEGFTTIVGFDGRFYQPVFYKSVLAIRGTGATSFGNRTMLYYLGGMENWLFAQFSDSTIIPQDQNYSYMALAPHLRGFDHNIRNGGSYLLANIEYRLPVVSMLFGNNIKNGFLKNLQFVGFLDAGMAWHGLTPFSKENPLNQDTITTTDASGQNIIQLNITYFRDPLAYGYGVGARSTLLGYYVKFDYAWGVETGQVFGPKWYISLGYDF